MSRIPDRAVPLLLCLAGGLGLLWMGLVELGVLHFPSSDPAAQTRYRRWAQHHGRATAGPVRR